MELKQLEYFLAIVETGAFSRAALKLSVGQPVLSRQIRALELELGADLYHRTGRGIVLTEAGKMLAEHAQAMAERSAVIKSEFRALGSALIGRVAIGMPPSVGAVLTTPLVARFHHEYPQVSLGVTEGFSGHVLEWLIDARIDVAILYNAPRISTLAADPLVTDELILLGPVADPAGAGNGQVEAERLSRIPLILPSRPHGLRVVVDECLMKAGIRPNIQVEIDAMPSTLMLVERGVAYTILSYSCVHHLVQAGRIRYWPIVEPTLTRTMVLATSTQRPVTKAARVLARMARTQIQLMVDQGRWHPGQGPAAARPPDAPG
ncbi:LysR substrate-binding domain-containing protein [Pigmentiphaga soli]|uniref:LysR substrate-binding domain-containing protein n=1 Tax=Pigmentiphaga soli TaxID=1007095 RepID=A0ABP8HMM7_9BURK